MIPASTQKSIVRVIAGLLIMTAAQYVVAVGMLIGSARRNVLAGQWGVAFLCTVMVLNTAYIIRRSTLDGSSSSGWLRAVVSFAHPRLFMLFGGLAAACWAYSAWLSFAESRGVAGTTFALLGCVAATSLVLIAWRMDRATHVSAGPKRSGDVAA